MIFVFGERGLPPGGFVARVPAGLVTEQELFDVLFKELRFPDYFGDNWNALEECIRDLSWLDPGTVIVVHEDVPLRANRAAVRIYVSILKGAVLKWQAGGDRLLVVAFPEAEEGEVDRVLLEASRFSGS